MTMSKLPVARRAAICALLLCAALPASAQVRPQPPFGPPPVIDPATVTMPDLTFTSSPQIAENFDKYFYFNRADTDFATAYADLRECDGYARGLSFRTNYVNVYAGGMLPSVAGGPVASAVEGRARG